MNPHHLLVARISSAARQTVSGYLPLFSGPDRSRTDHTDLARISRPRRHAGPSCLTSAFAFGLHPPSSVGGRALLPKARGVPLPYIPRCISVTRVGFEPNLSGLKDRQPHQKSNGPCCARTRCAEWVRRRSNPRLRIFSPPLSHLSYRPMIGRTSQPTKKARCRGDTGLWSGLRIRPRCHKRRFRAGSALFLCPRWQPG